VAELQSMAAELQGHLETPHLRWKYAWMRPIFGWKAAKRTQDRLPQLKANWLMLYDKIVFDLENSRATARLPVSAARAN
jgi:hypothetical protein